jgi:hypothetical protein
MSQLASLCSAALPLAAVLATPACKPARPVGSPNGRVARGELYKPGLVAYDEFFISVHEVQVEMAGVADDRKAARSALTQVLGLLPNAQTDRVLQVIKERAAELRKAGGRFVVSGESAHAEKGSGDDRSVAQGLSSCLAGERSIADRMSGMPERTDAMLQLSTTLDGSVDVDFPVAQRAQVKNELAVARQVLRSNAELARGNARTSEHFIEELVLAATGSKPTASSPAAPAATSHKPGAPGHKPRAAPPSGQPGTGQKPPDDFNP